MLRENRKKDELREIKITLEFLKNPLSSLLIEFGNTRFYAPLVRGQGPPFFKGFWHGLDYS